LQYASWQPVTTDTTVAGTKPPYYGNIVVAAFLAPAIPSALASQSKADLSVSVVQIPMSGKRVAAYAAYVSSRLARLIVINLEAHNSTVNGTGEVNDPDEPERPKFKYAFRLPESQIRTGWANVQRLAANGSDAISGITWDGRSYNRELDDGKPVRLRNVTVGENVLVNRGVVELIVEASEAVILTFHGGSR
jgi:glycosyl hydrolase family 79